MNINQSSIYMTKIGTTGTTISVATLNANDANNTYALYMFFVLGETNDMVNVTVNGITMDLPAGFQYNFSPISSITVNKIMCMKGDGSGVFVNYTDSSALSKSGGICVMGEKTVKTMFGN